MTKTEISMNEIELNGIRYVPKDSILSGAMAPSVDGLKAVIIRSYAAGVHFGYLKSENYTSAGKVVTLVNTRRIHTWNGACSLSQIALDGIGGGNVSVALPEIEVVNVIETIPLSEKAKTNLYTQKEWKK
jgi:hypothetical protein